jgi:DNA-binding NarL/FixJ family response regulator
METLRILLADDHALIRAGIRALLERLHGVEVVGEAGDGRETLALVKEHQPDIVLMDIAMPGLNGLEALLRIRQEYPDISVVILSVFSDEEFVAQALHMGAAGYLIKGSVPAELELALRAVGRGETYLSPSVSKQVVRQYLERVAGGSSLFEILTPRQREILQLIGEGHSTKEIAQILNLSIKTVERHKAELMDRLDIHDIAGLVRYAVRMKLVNPDQDRA